MEIKEIEIDKLRLDKNQPRKTFDEEKLNESVETFKNHGVIQPIEVDRNNVIITGELRYRAAKIAGLKTVPCKVLELTKEKRLERQLIENFNRQDMTLADNIQAVKRYMRSSKLPLQQVARKLGISDTWLSANLIIDKEAPKELKNALKKGQITISGASEIMGAHEKDRRRLTKNILQQAEIPEYRQIRAKVGILKKASNPVRSALLDDVITVNEADDIIQMDKEKQEAMITSIKHYKKTLKQIPKSIREGKVISEESKTFSDVIRKLNSELGATRTKMYKMGNILDGFHEKKVFGTISQNYKEPLLDVIGGLKRASIELNKSIEIVEGDLNEPRSKEE